MNTTTHITIRPLAAGDSIERLTALLHKAYATLLAQGWNFTAATQNVQTTRERVATGQAFVAERAGRLVGTVTIAPPKPADGRYLGDAVPSLYTETGTAILAQLAVHPDERGQGLAERLMDVAEQWAHGQGYRRVALDTAKPAEHLQRRYAKRGYAQVGEVQWDGKTYASVLMVKTLGEP
ncbi:GNAT family N-acetyltransferase [Paucibacter sp. M5-1]|uniref:GNAT family N-acetyltransferase n=1 Tax=Paucibacter sp. M5-1 TaxID=3015998 RepID=UPI0022B86436|nr:GNAT family N-acetyltransferase [Paucibacter sp. M5-1]MCZ7880017.1 GNAT family N-acetyltransferase [Paucibacter sp. M5-1]